MKSGFTAIGNFAHSKTVLCSNSSASGSTRSPRQPFGVMGKLQQLSASCRILSDRGPFFLFFLHSFSVRKKRHDTTESGRIACIDSLGIDYCHRVDIDECFGFFLNGVGNHSFKMTGTVTQHALTGQDPRDSFCIFRCLLLARSERSRNWTEGSIPGLDTFFLNLTGHDWSSRSFSKIRLTAHLDITSRKRSEQPQEAELFVGSDTATTSSSSRHVFQGGGEG